MDINFLEVSMETEKKRLVSLGEKCRMFAANPMHAEKISELLAMADQANLLVTRKLEEYEVLLQRYAAGSKGQRRAKDDLNNFMYEFEMEVLRFEIRVEDVVFNSPPEPETKQPVESPAKAKSTDGEASSDKPKMPSPLTKKK